MPTPLRQIRVSNELWDAFNKSLPEGENASSMIRQLMTEWLKEKQCPTQTNSQTT